MLSPAETAQKFIETGRAKTEFTFLKTFVLAVLAGVFIALAAEGSSFAIHTVQSVGLGKTLAGALFSTGLIMTVLGGAELFTGNTLISISVLAKQTRVSKFLKNLCVVFLGNFVGSMAVVLLIAASGQLGAGGGAAGAFAIKTAAAKTSLSFLNGVCSGVLCCILVCMGVWGAAAAKDAAGKIFACFFPIWLFITSGFEHSIANMYYIPAGLLAKNDARYVEAALDAGVTQAALDNLNWGTFLYGNLLPVTLGNLIGGAVIVGGGFFAAFLFKKKKNKSEREDNAL